MISPIKNNLNLLVGEVRKDNKAQSDNNLSFVDLLKKSIYQTNQLQLKANQITQDFALGSIDDIHQVTISTEKAQLALNLTISIQNKIIEAYKEIMRMQI